MKCPEPRFPSPLGRMQAVTPEDKRLSHFERQLIHSIGERLYGQRPSPGGDHG